MSDTRPPEALTREEAVEKALLCVFQLSGKDYRKMQTALSGAAFIRALEQDGYTVAAHPVPDSGPTVQDLADALAVVFAYNESCASVAPNGSLTYGGEPTSYWRDRAWAVREALASKEQTR